MSQQEKDALFRIAFDLLDDDKNVWMVKRKSIIWTTKKSYGTVYRSDIEFQCTPSTLFEKLLNCDKKTPMILDTCTLGSIDSQTDLIRVITAPSGCGLIKSKEFVNLRSWKQDGDSFLIVAKSLNVENISVKNNIMLWLIKPGKSPCTCVLQFMMCLEFNVMIAHFNIPYTFFKTYTKHMKQSILK